jgi:hypothetical protein
MRNLINYYWGTNVGVITGDPSIVLGRSYRYAGHRVARCINLQSEDGVNISVPGTQYV